MKFLKRIFGIKDEPPIDRALSQITNKVNDLSGSDLEFARHAVTSVWRIMEKVSKQPIDSDIFSITSSDSDRLFAYKCLLCHHCMLLFFRDQQAKNSMQAMIANITDKNHDSTVFYCNSIEVGCAEDSDTPVAITITENVWGSLLSTLGTTSSQESLGIMLIMTHFDHFKKNVRHLFE